MSAPPVADRPLHVVALVRSFGFPEGMAPTQRLRLVGKGLAEQGVDVRILITRVSERPPVVRNTAARGERDGVAFEYTAGSTVRSGRFLVRRLREARGVVVAALRVARLRAGGRLDAVYFWPGTRHWALVPWLWRAALRAAGVPVVSEENEMPWTLFEERSLMERLASPVKGFDGRIAISRWIEQWTRGEATRKGVDVAVLEVPILVDCAEQGVAPYPDGPPLLVFAASAAYEQTTRFVIAAMGPVWEEFPDCRLAITGVNPSEPRARWLMDAGRAGALDERIELPGYLDREELLALYAGARALLVPLFDDVRSRARFPTKIGEYAAAGRPMVASAVGEVDRFFTDEVDAFLCPPDDVAAYGEAILRALRDPARAAAVGLAARALAERAFDYRVHAPRLTAFFREVAARRGHGANG